MATTRTRKIRKAIILACELTAELTAGITDTILGITTLITTAAGGPRADPPTPEPAVHHHLPPHLLGQPFTGHETPPNPAPQRNWSLSSFGHLRDGDIAHINGTDMEVRGIQDAADECTHAGHIDLRHVHFIDHRTGDNHLVTAAANAPLLIAPGVPDTMSI